MCIHRFKDYKCLYYRVVKLWKESLKKVNEKASLALADPDEYENLFPSLNDAIKAEQYIEQTHTAQPAAAYPSIVVSFLYIYLLKTIINYFLCCIFLLFL